MVRHTDQSETQLLHERHHRRPRAARAHPGRRRLHLPRLVRLHHRPGVLLRRQPRRHRRLAAEARLPRGDGRRLGALRGVAAPPGGRHRDRGGDRLGSLLHRRPVAHLPDGDGPVLPGAHRRRPAHLRRPPGPGRHRRRHRRRALHGRGLGAVAGQGRRRRAARRRLRARAAAPPRPAAHHRRRRRHGARHAATGPASWSSARRTSPASTTARSATTRRSGPSTTRRPPASRPRPRGSGRRPSRSPSSRPPSPTRSCCCARCSASATTSR